MPSFLKHDPETPSDDERATILWSLEYLRICLSVGFTESGRMLLATLVVSDKPVSILGLAESNHISRTVVRDRVDYFEKIGLVSRVKGEGIILNQENREAVIQMFREIMELSMKKRRYFSPGFAAGFLKFLQSDTSRTSDRQVGWFMEFVPPDLRPEGYGSER